MHRLSPVAILFIAIGLVVVPQIACTQNGGGPAVSNVSTPVPQATPDKAAIVAEITRIENDWPRVVKEKDAATLKRVEADDVLLVYPDGSTGNKDQDARDIEAGNLTADSMTISDVTVNVLSNDLATASLLQTVKNGKYKMANGKAQDVSGQFRLADTFVRRDGRWQLVLSAGVPVRNPAPTASPTPAASPAAPTATAPSTAPSKAAPPPPPAKASPATRATPTRPVPKPATTP
jgi:ketosteroid isomerase-like protein